MAHEIDRQELRELLIGVLLEKVREERYPSNSVLDLLEQNLEGDDREELASILMEKIAADRYPSTPMVKRAIRLSC